MSICRHVDRTERGKRQNRPAQHGGGSGNRSWRFCGEYERRFIQFHATVSLFPRETLDAAHDGPKSGISGRWPANQLHSLRTRPSSVARVFRTSNSTRIIPINGTNPAAITMGSKT